MQESRKFPVALSIAGSDSGGGAGIQADLKTFAAHGVFGVTALTMVTAQSTSSVDRVQLLPPLLVREQLETLFSDFNIGVVKTGALGDAELIRAVADFLRTRNTAPVVIDPVMISKHGHPLLAGEATESLISELLPLATLVTPNIPEAEVLSGLTPIDSPVAMEEAAAKIASLGAAAVVIKGGHRLSNPVDILWLPEESHVFMGDRIPSQHTHGTGCTFSSAIAANLLKGLELPAAVRTAKDYVGGAIRHAQAFGQGINPVNHFWQEQPTYGAIK